MQRQHYKLIDGLSFVLEYGFYLKLLRKFVSTVRGERDRFAFDHVVPRMKTCKFSYFFYFVIKKKVFTNNLSRCSYLFIRMRDSMMLLSVDVKKFTFLLFL